jgi:hypothetical protein
MKVFIKKTGGFMGVDFEGEVDTTGLSDEENKLLEKIIHKKSDDPQTVAQADQFQYEITVNNQSVSFPSSAILPEEFPLIKKLESKLHPSS